MNSEGEFVESGFFRVDRSKAVEKLTQYQLPDAWHFVRLWLRAAVLHKPSRIDLRCGERTTRLRFDGPPLTAAQMRDPFAPLFNESEASEAAKYLAIGLLALDRLNPAGVEILSGGLRWVRGPGDREETTRLPSPTSNEITIHWDDDAPEERFAEEARGCMGPLDVRVYVNGAPFEPPDWSRSFDGARPEGYVVIGPDQDGKPYASLYRNGILLERIPNPTFEGLDVHLECSRLKLDLSATRAVRDPLFARLMELATMHANILKQPYKPTPWSGRESKTVGPVGCVAMALLSPLVFFPRFWGALALWIVGQFVLRRVLGMVLSPSFKLFIPEIVGSSVFLLLGAWAVHPNGLAENLDPVVRELIRPMLRDMLLYGGWASLAVGVFAEGRVTHDLLRARREARRIVAVPFQADPKDGVR